MSKPARIYLSPPHLCGSEVDHVREAIESNWISSVGPALNAFEERFAEMAGVERALALVNGTAALHLALQVAGVGPGDEVLCSTFTFVASSNPIRYLGAEPVFIDSDWASWNMDPALCVEEIKRLVAAGTPPAAVLPVHLYGQSVDVAPILEVCQEHGIPVIEDAAEAVGATYRGRPAGTWGDLGVFSFNGNKIITTSGGGILTAKDGRLLDQAASLATQAKAPTEDLHYLHETLGFNYRMSNLLAAFGLGQLEVLEERVRRRREIFDFYLAHLGELPGVAFMPEADFGTTTRWLTCLTIDPSQAGGSRAEVQAALETENIESRPLWRPMHTQPIYAGARVVGGGVSEALYRDGLCLPSGSSLTEDDLVRIIAIVRGVLAP